MNKPLDIDRETMEDQSKDTSKVQLDKPKSLFGCLKEDSEGLIIVSEWHKDSWITKSYP